MPAHIHQLDTRPDSAYLREALRTLVQSFIELEVSAFIEANHYERNDSRRTQRNGYRQRTWRSETGEITLFIPKLRKGTYYPEFLDHLSKSEGALVEVAQDAYRHDVQSRDIDQLAKRLGLSPIQGNQLVTIEEQLRDLAQRHKFQHFTHSAHSPISALYSTDELEWIGQPMRVVDLAA